MYKLLSTNILRRYISTGYITNIRSGAIRIFPTYFRGLEIHDSLIFSLEHAAET